MFAFKVKAVIAAFALVCGLGYGAWAAGSGDGPGAGMGGAGAQPAPSGKAAIPEAGQPNPTRGPRIELARQELQILGVTLKATGKGKVDPEMLERILAELNAIEGLLDPDSVNGVKVPPERNSDASNPTRARWIGDPGTVEKFDSTDAELQLLLGDLASKLHNAKIDPMYAEQLRDRVEMARWMLRESRKAAGVDNPSDPVARAELDLYRAKMQMLRAQAESERSQTAAAVAQASYEKAKAEVEAAKRKRARDAKEPPAANDPAFTIHLRTQLDAEKVIRVKATGNETVLDAISRVGEVLPIKAGGVRVWLVRDGKVLPVERAAILQGQTATNYILQPGDKLFVQSGTGK